MDLPPKGEAWARDQHLKLTTMANDKVTQIDLAVDDHLEWFRQHATIESLLATRSNSKKRPRPTTPGESDGESASTKRSGRQEAAETDEEFFDAPDHESEQENIPSPPAVRRSPRTRHRELAEQAPPATRRKQSHHDDTQDGSLIQSGASKTRSPEIQSSTGASDVSDGEIAEPSTHAVGTESYIAAVEAPVIEIPAASPLIPKSKRPSGSAPSAQIARDSGLVPSKGVRAHASPPSCSTAAAPERVSLRRSTDQETLPHSDGSRGRSHSMGSSSSRATRTSQTSAKTALSRRTEERVGMSSMVSIGSLDLPKVSAPDGIHIPAEKKDIADDEEEDRVQLVRVGRHRQSSVFSSNQPILIPYDYQPDSEEQPDPVVDLTSVPAWAKDPDLGAQLERQSKVDADRIFGRIRTVNLDAIFPPPAN